MNIGDILDSVPDGTLAVVLVVWLFLRYVYRDKPPPPPPPPTDYYPPN